jgi:hypothetical protein
MKKMLVIGAGILLFSSTAIFAENHSAAAREQANAAVIKGGDGQTAILLKHAKAALKHTEEASKEATGVSKNHLDAAAKELQEAHELGKWGHVGSATAHAEAALKHIESGNKYIDPDANTQSH